MSKRQEDFFNEATKQIRDSYVFQNEEMYSDNDVMDIATSLAEYSYQYAIDKICDLLADRVVHDSIDYPMATKHLIDDIRREMEDKL